MMNSPLTILEAAASSGFFNFQELLRQWRRLICVYTFKMSAFNQLL
jgi:hypothetical protein